MSVATLGSSDAATHAVMLLDRVRVEAYARAIARVVRPGDVVVDVGAGTGVLSVLAARAGARRVWALEQGPAARVAALVAAQSGVGEVVRVVRADAREASFDEPPTVLLSETLGSAGIDENITGLFSALAPRCAPDVRRLPEVVEPMVALIADEALAAELAALDDIAGTSFAALRQPLAHRPLPCRLRPADLVGEAAPLGSLRPGLDPSPRVLRATLRLGRDASVNGLGCWFRARLAEGVELSSGPLDPPTHWHHLLLPLDPPLVGRAGDEVEVELRPRLLHDQALWAWRARRGDDERKGDAMLASMGDVADLAPGLALGPDPAHPATAARLAAWRAALDGPLAPDAMAARVQAALPARYPDEAAAGQEVMALLAAASAGG